MSKLYRTKDIVMIAVAAAIICVVSPFTITVGPIPFSLASFAVYLTGLLLERKKGTFAVFIYIIIGFCGLPVFSNFTGGPQKILGVTGGFIIGYLPCVWLTGFISHIKQKQLLFSVAGMVAGTVVLYIFGTVWYVLMTGNNFAAAATVCVLPFLPVDTIKIVAATAIIKPLRKLITLPIHK